MLRLFYVFHHPQRTPSTRSAYHSRCNEQVHDLSPKICGLKASPLHLVLNSVLRYEWLSSRANVEGKQGLNMLRLWPTRFEMEVSSVLSCVPALVRIPECHLLLSFIRSLSADSGRYKTDSDKRETHHNTKLKPTKRSSSCCFCQALHCMNHESPVLSKNKGVSPWIWKAGTPLAPCTPWIWVAPLGP